MGRIAICNSSIEDGDAISNDMVGMAKALSNQGHEVCLFAEESKLANSRVRPINEMMTFVRSSNDLVIYHYGAGWDLGVRLLSDLNCRKAVKYHNVTPPEFFVHISPDHENHCRAGRKQLRDLAVAGVDMFFADSEYSKVELIDLGIEAQRCFAIPPFHHIDQLALIDADLRVVERFGDQTVNILMVGRFVPNKAHDLLIESFGRYHKEYNSDSRLLLVGWEDPRLKAYIEGLKMMVKSENLEQHVIFAGKVSIEALKAYYLAANVFMVTSKHEGFCVPLVEAMFMKIPIVAYASSAIPGTVGGAGIVWDEYNPDFMAASVHKIVRDAKVGVGLGEMGWQRYQSMFTNERIESLFLGLISELL